MSGNTESGKNVLVGIELDELRPTIATAVTDGGHRLDDARTKRALIEEMDVWLSREGGLYGVRKASSSRVYEVDVVAETYSCPDWQQSEAEGGCKHLRRVDLEIRAGRVPRPDGRLVDGGSRVAAEKMQQ